LEFSIPNGATVYLNGVARGTAPLSGRIRIVSGKTHELTIKKEGEILLSRNVKLGSKEILSVKTDAPKKQEEAIVEKTNTETTPVVSTADNSNINQKNTPLKTAGITLLSSGLAMGIAGGITGGIALSKSNKIDEVCPDNFCTTQDDFNLKDESKNLGIATNILISVGVAVTVTGIIFMIINNKKSDESTAKKITTDKPGVSFNGLTLKGHF